MTPRNVVVTGASGFVGSCVVEALFVAGSYRIVPTSRRLIGGARVARFGCRLQPADLTDPAAVAELVAGADAVVHCAFGSDSDQVEAARILVQAAAQSGVRDFVHLSSTDVYTGLDGTLTEDAPIYSSGEGYGSLKARIESVLRSHADNFQSFVILRPPPIYGPLSDQWTINPIRRILAGWRPRAEQLQGAANVVHIADVCRTIRWGLEKPMPGLRTYNVVGPGVVSWIEYFESLTRALQAASEPQASQTDKGEGIELGFVRAMLRLLPTSVRLKLTRTATSVPAGMRTIERWRRMNFLNLTPGERDFYARKVRYSSVRLASEGFAPSITLEQGARHSAAWARLVGLVR